MNDNSVDKTSVAVVFPRASDYFHHHRHIRGRVVFTFRDTRAYAALCRDFTAANSHGNIRPIDLHRTVGGRRRWRCCCCSFEMFLLRVYLGESLFFFFWIERFDSRDRLFECATGRSVYMRERDYRGMALRCHIYIFGGWNNVFGIDGKNYYFIGYHVIRKDRNACLHSLTYTHTHARTIFIC